ncbi:MAG: glucose-6-phosphate dehydrogenase [Nostoc sp. DedSLP03]|uniref:glucose-6-phosphate dehydrogenase n=1 Tax=Nostoc sp. DedSLP03 TaxID=3075400 RepID=UPI002AD416D3|nr:glucose-6-phosphate dehydrogenase [Nostoc sp. DedSLP03]MDZ7970822.1 glucose-6-phosphate dehydrogenase [Nostoc sp. DedSLP03]
MTAFNPATDIPSQIDTLEKLAAWLGSALFTINPTLTVIEGVGYTERACQANNFWVGADAKTRMIIRFSLEVSPDQASGSNKNWTYIQQLSNTPLPASFKQN